MKAALEALSLPLKDASTKAAAKTALKALAGYTTANATFHAADVAANNATAAHSPVQPFIDVELAVVQPFINAINTRRAALGCK